MPSLKQKLPPLSTLLTFEAAARHLSFTTAGEELHVTQTAVSRQIRGLEEFLGVTLFKRGHRNVQLTGQGQKLLQAVSMGLEHISTAVGEIRNIPPQGHLTVSATIAFASLWLTPRLMEFQKQYPDLEVRILATDRDINLQAENVDFAFSCGNYDKQSGITSTYLFADEIFPVCSADYLSKHGPVKKPEDLLQHDLLHLDEEHWRGISWEATDWSVWLKSQGVESVIRSRGLRVNNYPLLLQTAINSQGIALGWSHLVSDLLEQGLLVRPLQASLCTQRGYYLAQPSIGQPTEEVRIFRDWILEQAEANRKQG